jgi:hypothetical protein
MAGRLFAANWGWAGILLLGLALAAGPGQGQEVIVNADVELSHIDRNAARLIVTKRMNQWPDKRPVTVFVLPDDNPLHQDFAKRVLEVYPYQLRRTWDRQVFSGTGQAPFQVRNEQEMLDRVSQTAGAIGYISKTPAASGIPASGIKVLEVR